MPRKHVAASGESIESIAFQYGLFWETVWNAPENSPLREKRKEPNILAPGDEVIVPDLQPKALPVSTGATHVFRRRGVPSVLRVRLLEGDSRPRAGVAYTVVANGVSKGGQTDQNGEVVCYLMPDVQRGELRIDATGEVFVFQVGTVGQTDTPSGVESRLRNLGYLGGAQEGGDGPDLAEALRAFQRRHQLPESGEADAATIAALEGAHGS